MDDNRALAGNLLAAARKIPANTEIAQLTQSSDLHMQLSRIDAAPPYFVIYEADSVLNQLAGTGTLECRLSNVRWHGLVPGDIVYIPAGTPHRYVPAEESVQLKYKAANPGAEAVGWFCRRCDTELFRRTFDPAAAPVEDGYAAAVEAFEGDPTRHSCPTCGLHSP